MFTRDLFEVHPFNLHIVLIFNFFSIDDGCELQLDSTSYVSSGNFNRLADKEMIALPEKFDACLPKSTGFQSSSICPTFSAFTFSSWSLENEERLMEDGKDVQQEKVIGTGNPIIRMADYFAVLVT